MKFTLKELTVYVLVSTLGLILKKQSEVENICVFVPDIL
jgi:hypothetical protein